jgi:alanine dehydrogenase
VAGAGEADGSPLVVGVPTEIKDDERRVAITPDGVAELRAEGVPVLVEAGAGRGSAIPDEAFRAAGAELVGNADELWERAELVCKVKEPQPEELGRLRSDLVLFAFLHLAAYKEVADALVTSGATAFAYETVQRADGRLPLLAPMSEVAGRLAVQVGARFLEAPQGGRGVLLGGAPGVRPARVAVLGAGNVGWNAAWIAAGMEAEVVLLDNDLDRLRFVDQIHRGRISTLASNRGALERVVPEADLLIGAVLVPGGRAPVVVTEDLVQSMAPGSVIVDTAVDQGGCVASTRETTHHDPVFEHHGVLHYGVGNMPGAVPRTSTWALTNATLPYLRELARLGPERACAVDPVLASGRNVEAGAITNEAVAAALAAA